MRRAGTLTEEDFAELEIHLRDSVADLMRRGLSQDEAILVALRRIGDPSVLAVEYQKVNPGLAWARRWYWMTAGFLGFSIVVQGIQALSYLTGWLALPTGAAISAVLSISIAGYGAVSIGILHSAQAPSSRLSRSLQSIANWVERHPVASAAGALGMTLGLRFANGMATSKVWGNLHGPSYALFYLGAVGAIVIPILLFLIGRRVNPEEDLTTD